ncbi:O-antigen ligase family protein [Haloplanus aerogenes]|uniref:O-antigen ligase-related domain-containing protein n=1 Tax=Haloplanus aerogenes TaxID=660522 RepID=A0A3M0DS19_9EURY|nr:O-antigen ligase family protein [Haloplanus aerogenes]AZH24756.1 hypothetical protein DU502_04885 [Haloplanus aerogenes]RMB23580.1 hypothetical protein ATH50_0796 [Haloplanus aerogenes]
MNEHKNRTLIVPLFVSAFLLSALVEPIIPDWVLIGFKLFGFWNYVGAALIICVHLSRNPRIRLSLLSFAPIGIFLYSSSVSVIASPAGLQTPVLVEMGQHLVEFAVIVLMLRTRLELERTLWIIPLTVAITLLVATWELATGTHFGFSRLALDNFSTVRGTTALWHNRNDFSYFLALSTPIVIYKVRHANIFDHLLSALVVLIVATIIAYNGTRSAFLALVLSCLLYVAAIKQRSSTRHTFRVYRFGTLSVIAILFGVICVPLLENPFLYGSSLWIRWQLLTLTPTLLMSWPMGVGIGNIPPTVAKIPIATSGVFSPHNWAFQLLAELGIVGALFAIIVIGKSIDVLAYHWFSGKNEIALPLFLTLVSFLIAGFAPSNAFWGMHIIWIALGFAISCQAIPSQSNTIAHG